jgi:hypothetical protein
MDPAYLLNMEVFPDDLANISVLNIPVDIKIPRVFSIKMKEDTTRGKHAHKECWQIILSITHEVDVVVNFGQVQSKYRLLPLTSILVAPPMNWVELNCPKNSIVTVLTSQIFSESDYIRNFEEYLDVFLTNQNLSRKGKIN